jgi:hypothetical protein
MGDPKHCSDRGNNRVCRPSILLPAALGIVIFRL